MAQSLKIDEAVKQRLVVKLRQHGEAIRFGDDPALASLCSCLGLQHELGQPELDRLSPFFGRMPGAGRPWRSELVASPEGFGLAISPVDGRRLEVRHEDFRWILDRESFDDNGTLSRLVIYPAKVANTFAAKGFELVIVRDWLLTSCLVDSAERVPYLYANEWEIRNNIARTQIGLMLGRRLAFSGTHDIVDHLLGADAARFDESRALLERARNVFEACEWNAPQLLLSYLIGVALDDLAQPRWYGSRDHHWLVGRALDHLPALAGGERALVLPASFHEMVRRLRAKGPAAPLTIAFRYFLRDIR